MEKMKIEIWSDIACPYCYIGKRKLEKALNLFEHKDQVELVWHSYELNPSLPKSALDKSFLTYIGEQHSTAIDESKKFLDKLTQLAKSVGIDYHLDRLVVTNTSDALRLVKLAQCHKLATEMEEALFEAYFVDGKCISCPEILIDLGEKVGLPKEEIIELLKNDKFREEIDKDIRYSEDHLMLEYIPFYLFNNKYVIQGSVKDDDYLSTLQKSYTDWKENGIGQGPENSVEGQSCSIDGKCS